MSAWSNLPNAAHIDRVIAHVKAHHDKWASARDPAREADREADREAAWDAVYDADRHAFSAAVWDAAWGAAGIEVWGPAWDACLALIAWDEAGDLVGKNPQQLIALSYKGVHAATLLLPAGIAMAETGGASVSLDEVEATTMQTELENALQKAFLLGQTYWQQADSQSYSENKRSDQTWQKLETLKAETCALLKGKVLCDADELARYKALAGELAEALREAAQRNAWESFFGFDRPIMSATQVDKAAKAALAKYEKENGNGNV